MAVYDKNGKVIKSAVNYGWEVTSSDVPKALDMWVEYVGEDNALEDVARAMDDDTLIENIEWVAQQWGIGEEVEEERSAWDKYEKAKELMGVHELFTNLTQAAGYDELAEDLAYIFRMNDFRQWDDMEVYSSRKPIKSSKSWKADRMIQEMYDQHYITEEGYNAALQKQYSDDEINTLERYYVDYRNPNINWDDIRNIIKGTMSIIQSSRKPIKSSANNLDDLSGEIYHWVVNAGALDELSEDERNDYMACAEHIADKIRHPEEFGYSDETPEAAMRFTKAIADKLKGDRNLRKEIGFDKTPQDERTPDEKWEDYVYSKDEIKSSKEEKADPNDPHMKFKTLDPEYKMNLREDIEDELEALLKKLNVKFDLETWNETVDYILSFFEEDNFYNPKNAKQAVHEWYLDTKDEFPDMFDSKKTKIASSAYREFIHNKMSIKSTHNLIKSSVEEEDPVEVVLKDAAEHLGATYKEGWWGKGIQEGNGRWNGSKWAVVVDKNGYNDWPQIHFIAAKGDSTEMSGGVTPMNATAAQGEDMPANVIDWIKDKIDESNAGRASFDELVNKFKSFEDDKILWTESNPSARTVHFALDTEDEDVANDLAEQIKNQVGCDNCSYQIYDFYETSEDKYEDIDPDTRDKKEIIFYL